MTNASRASDAMSDAAIFLWPLFAMFALAAIGSAWQARNPAAEAAARARIVSRNWQLPRWRQMPQWNAYQSQQHDPARIARVARRRAFIFAGIAAAILAFLLTGSR